MRTYTLRLAMTAIMVTVVYLGPNTSTIAQTPVPTPAVAKQVLKLTKSNWIQFRNYQDTQFVYFTHFLSWKCALKEIRYSVNSKDLAHSFPLPDCNPDSPFHVNPEKDLVYLSFPLGEAKTVSIQVIFKDDTESAVRSFKPCKVKGDQTCGKPAEMQ